MNKQVIDFLGNFRLSTVVRLSLAKETGSLIIGN